MSELVVVVLMIVGIAVFVWAIWQSNRQVPVLVRARVNGSPENVLRDLQLGLAGSKNTTVQRDTSDSVTTVWSYIPGWAVLVAILLFPIGLLALIARNTATGTIFVQRDESGATVMRFGGDFSKHASQAIERVIAAYS